MDNSNPIKWKILSLEKNRYAEVPSVCFSLEGPDAELNDSVDKYLNSSGFVSCISFNFDFGISRLLFKYEQLEENIKKFDIHLKKEKVTKIMKEIINDSESSKVNNL